MKHGTICGCLTALLLTGFSLGALAEIKDNPYQVIIERNPFALKPIPPPPPVDTTPATNPPPPVEIKLTGITTLLGPPKVFLQFMNQQTKKVDFPPGMMVGEKQGDIEILAVDPDNGLVRIRHGDAETTLDFTNNGVKPTGVASAAPPAPGIVPLNPGFAPPASPGAPSANGGRAIVAGNNMSAVNPGANPNANPFANANGIPQRPLRADFGNNVIVSGNGQSVTGQTPAPAAQPTMSHEDAMARIEAQRQILLQRENQGLAPKGISGILPPTRFTPQPQPQQNPGQ